MLRFRLQIALLAATAALALAATPAAGRMKSTKLDTGVCLTVGGGRFVDVPGFPGEQIDRRLLRDVRWLVREYKIFVTDGFSTSDVHSANGEHPVGLALDIVPNRATGGTWAEITALAQFAEPRRDAPIAPFRWVGYDGDANHGRGHHLHLSWSHSPARFGRPAESVYTMRCPRPKRKRGDGGGGSDEPDRSVPSGGAEAGEAPAPDPDGGIRPRVAPRVIETSGVE